MQIQPASFAFTLLLGLLTAVPYSGIDINLPAIAATGATLGGCASDVGLTMSAFMLSLAVAPLFYGPVSDRFGRKPVVSGRLFCRQLRLARRHRPRLQSPASNQLLGRH